MYIINPIISPLLINPDIPQNLNSFSKKESCFSIIILTGNILNIVFYGQFMTRDLFLPSVDGANFRQEVEGSQFCKPVQNNDKNMKVKTRPKAKKPQKTNRTVLTGIKHL